MARNEQAVELLGTFAEMARSVAGAVAVRRVLLKQLATSPEADALFAAAFESGRWTDEDTFAVAEALLKHIEQVHERETAFDPWEDEWTEPQLHYLDGLELDDLRKLYGALGRALVRENTGRDDPGSLAAERREGHTDSELDYMAQVDRDAAREAAQVEYWAQRDMQERKRVRRPDTRYWDVASWPEAQQAREYIDAQQGVTQTWVKKTDAGYKIVWNGPAFLTGDEVRHVERGDIGRIDEYKAGYFAVTWLDGRRGAYKAHDLERF